MKAQQKKYKGLTKYQQEALLVGQQQLQKPSQSMRELLSIVKVFQKVDKSNKDFGDSTQTLQDFLSMKGIQPNQEGTGRRSFSQVATIQYTFIHKIKRPKVIPTKTKKLIQSLLQSYLRIKTKQINLHLCISQTNQIEDQLQQIQYQLKSRKSKKASNRIFDALQLLDLLIQYKSSQSKLLVCFIDAEISENGLQIYGRACGDGVAVIELTTANHEELRIMMETTIHETLHTLGFDHCLAWKCLMNPLVNDELWLCPCCLRKLLSEIQLECEQWIQGINKRIEQWQFNDKNKGSRMLQILEKSRKR